MTKFGSKYGTTPKVGSGPIKTTGTVVTNHGGASAFARDAKSDLFLLGVMNFVGEDTFYESATTRDDRFKNLVHTVTQEDPDWVERFIPWLRNEANMRSASVVAAVEYVRAGGPNGRKVIASACSRADEPAEVLAYWIGNYGRPIKSSVKRGVGDAARKLWNEKSLAKYDTSGKQFRFADVINLAHVKPKDDKQARLFKYALDVRFGTPPSTEGLPLLEAAQRVNKGEITRDELLAETRLIKDAGVTWESLSGLGAMDAAAWEAMIPTMGYMALLRNLRNFEQAGISLEATNAVIQRLSSAEEVAKSRQLPYRFWSAYKNVAGLQWGWALEQALGHSLQNLPELGGRTLILTDTSASMSSMGFSGKSTITPLEAAAVFASALALKGEKVDFYGFADGVDKVELSKGGSVLKTVEKIKGRVGAVGHGTNIPGAMAQWDGHDRVILISDMQTLGRYERSNLSVDPYMRNSYYRANRYSAATPAVKTRSIPESVPVFGFNLGGYGNTQIDTSKKNEFELGGLTDHTFKLITLLERGGKGEFPF